jgi:hypothetical protein
LLTAASIKDCRTVARPSQTVRSAIRPTGTDVETIPGIVRCFVHRGATATSENYRLSRNGKS